MWYSGNGAVVVRSILLYTTLISCWRKQERAPYGKLEFAVKVRRVEFLLSPAGKESPGWLVI
jgi:hypothetical protein